MAGALGAIYMLAYLGLAVFQLFAVMEGLDSWLDFGTVLSVVVFAIAFVLGPIGGLIIGVIGFFGAMEGWGWEWWQAALLCFPFMILSFLATGIAGIFSLFQRA